ncbi:hypothetical protein KGMB02408_16750 [Bacteroides faecalis]|uniref:Glycosyl hydrolase family 32 N-terminal domain-containing protein n=2 Tax=Bacteroides faecalis TaxID=2447885 RepID=A0A401LT21_9BACE|nr:hypothetical protein KGMB02408_16750 [Bacteroides faecalis]
MLRKLLYIYRVCIYSIFGKPTDCIVKKLNKCEVLNGNKLICNGDVVHPCVRKSLGFRGKEWWLTYTPYYAADENVENPYLCYSIGDLDSWQVFEQVKGAHVEGYNSDPSLLFDNDNCYIFWRENHTRTVLERGFQRGIFVKKYTSDTSVEMHQPIIESKDLYIDPAVSPCFIKIGDSYRCYAMHLRFKNEKFIFKNRFLNKFSNVFLAFSSALHIYNQTISYGISIYESKNVDGNYKYWGTYKISNINCFYTPWHCDFFEWKNNLYAVIQTSQCNADIILAESTDYIHFKAFQKPLITNSEMQKCGLTGFYKPTAVVDKGIFYLYVSAQSCNNRKLNQLYSCSYNFDELLNKLRGE